MLQSFHIWRNIYPFPYLEYCTDSLTWCFVGAGLFLFEIHSWRNACFLFYRKIKREVLREERNGWKENYSPPSSRYICLWRSLFFLVYTFQPWQARPPSDHSITSWQLSFIIFCKTWLMFIIFHESLSFAILRIAVSLYLVIISNDTVDWDLFRHRPVSSLSTLSSRGRSECADSSAVYPLRCDYQNCWKRIAFHAYYFQDLIHLLIFHWTWLSLIVSRVLRIRHYFTDIAAKPPLPPLINR